MMNSYAHSQESMAVQLPRLGFVGVGWIGRLRMEALLEYNTAQCCALHDTSLDAIKAAVELEPAVEVYQSFRELLDSDLDGIVIATPSAMHAGQCIQALNNGKAVFCQKPLARTLAETSQVVEAARAADRLLSVDFSYRHLAGVGRLREMISAGDLGDIFAADLVFHNAYGPDKPWFYDVEAAGGGCVIDLGIHLVDLAMWLLDEPHAKEVSSSLFAKGRRLAPPYLEVEDFAEANFELGPTQTRLCCSWNLNAGRDAIIEAKFYGTKGGAAISNVNGSFFDFEVQHFQGTASHQLAIYPDDWGGRALNEWVEKLSYSPAFDQEVEQVIRVAKVIDRVYHR